MTEPAPPDGPFRPGIPVPEIELRGVTVNYGSVAALCRVSAALPAGTRGAAKGRRLAHDRGTALSRRRTTPFASRATSSRTPSRAWNHGASQPASVMPCRATP